MEIIKGIINIEQLPVITEKFESISAKAKEDVNKALSLPATEENKQAIKKVRTALRKDFDMYEGARKAVNKEIEDRLKPFNDAYSMFISGVYKPADAELKARLDGIDSELLERKISPLKEYFSEKATAEEVDFIKWEDMHFKFTLSKTDASCKKEIDSRIENIVNDMKVADTFGDKANEIKFEYMKNLNISESIKIVTERYEALERLKETTPEPEPIQGETKAVIDEPLSPPETVEEEKKYRCNFTVNTTLLKLKKLKEFMLKEGIEYEQ